MTHTLSVSAGDHYTIDSGDTERYGQADIDGTLNVDGSLILGHDQPGHRGDNPFYDDLVDVDFYEDMAEPKLYDDLVRSSPVSSQPAVIAVLGVLALLTYAAVKMRSIIVGALLLIVVISFVLAVLVDTSMVYFWIAAILGFFGVAAALIEASR